MSVSLNKTFVDSYVKWFVQEIENLPDLLESLTPSEWSEKKRYLPKSLTPFPGFFKFSQTPYLKEILDCFDPTVPIREVSIMKGSQLGFTVGVLENLIGYHIDHVKTAPMMFLTADGQLANLRVDKNIVPMIQHSSLQKNIQSGNEMSRNKTGLTAKKIEWQGGGFLLPFGARNASNLRSMSIQILLEDEVDGYPVNVGQDGCPMKLAEDRTKGFSQTKKILRISTPLLKGTSRIEPAYLDGDQRKYFVPCVDCGEMQELVFRYTNKNTGEFWGLDWKTDEYGYLIQDSVVYICQFCGFQHKNFHKKKMLPAGEWRPTSTPKTPYSRSYHLNALYSPVGMYSWEEMVQSWLDCYDDEAARAKSIELLQRFYNNDLGKTFENKGKSLRFEMVSEHRRPEYVLGEIPNKFSEKFCGSRIQLLTCAVDVHKSFLSVAVFGWAKNNTAFLIDYWKFEGDCSDLSDKNTWKKLQNVIEGKSYISDRGEEYHIQFTLVDSGFETELVYSFCDIYQEGVYPCKGRDLPTKSSVTMKEFSQFVTSKGQTAFSVTVDLYKDFWSRALRKNWDGISFQPPGHFNAPVNTTDEMLKELTVEFKRRKIEKSTGKLLGFEWHRPGNARNELWDLLVYNSAALDIIILNTCIDLGYDHSNRPVFWNHLQENNLFLTEK